MRALALFCCALFALPVEFAFADEEARAPVASPQLPPNGPSDSVLGPYVVRVAPVVGVHHLFDISMIGAGGAVSLGKELGRSIEVGLELRYIRSESHGGLWFDYVSSHAFAEWNVAHTGFRVGAGAGLSVMAFRRVTNGDTSAALGLDGLLRAGCDSAVRLRPYVLVSVEGRLQYTPYTLTNGLLDGGLAPVWGVTGEVGMRF